MENTQYSLAQIMLTFDMANSVSEGGGVYKEKPFASLTWRTEENIEKHSQK